MSVHDWADRIHTSEVRGKAVDQRLVNAIQSLLDGQSTAQVAAHSITSVLDPQIKQDAYNLQNGAVWDIICDAVRTLGGNKELSESLIDLLFAIKDEPELQDDHGNVVKHEWGGKYWSDLPTWNLIFREYGMDINNPEGMELSEWLAQAPALLNATTFAAVYLARESNGTSMGRYAESCMMNALEDWNDEPEPQYRAVMWVPPAATWISIAGKTIFCLCKTNYNRKDYTQPGPWGKGSGYSMERWTFWKQRFTVIGNSEGFDGSVRHFATRAAEEMNEIERGA